MKPAFMFPKSLKSSQLIALFVLDGSEGNKILDYKDASLEERNQIAMNMFRAWYVPFYYYGIIHGDPHLGNYSVRPDLSINLLDFGCVRIFLLNLLAALLIFTSCPTRRRYSARRSCL